MNYFTECNTVEQMSLDALANVLGSSIKRALDDRAGIDFIDDRERCLFIQRTIGKKCIVRGKVREKVRVNLRSCLGVASPYSRDDQP